MTAIGYRPSAIGPKPTEAPCIVFVLEREALFFRRSFQVRQTLAGAPCRAHLGDVAGTPVLVLQTGLGAEAAARAVTWILGDPSYRPRWVLSAGFSGALRPDLRVGDLLLATEVVDAEGNQWRATGVEERLPWRRGRLLTSPRLVAGPREKQELGARHDALAVDMETAAIAQVCHRHQVPFGCLRAISDDWNRPLSPQLVDVLRGGRVSPLRLMSVVLRRPRLAGELWRLARHTRIAARQIHQGLTAILVGNAARQTQHQTPNTKHQTP
jgi:adenosylhomocysteine nucleosidase